MRQDDPIDTKLALLSKDVKHLSETIGKDLGYVQDGFREVKDSMVKIEERFSTLENKFVTRTEFSPIKKVVYGLVSVSLMAVISAILATVIT